MSDRVRLSNAILLSILAHTAALALLPLLGRVRLAAPVAPALFDVDVVPLARPAAPAPAAARAAASEAPAAAPPPVLPLPAQQIVSPPDAGHPKPPPETRFLSDRDTTVDQQTVRRGEPVPGQDRPRAEAGERADARAGSKGAPRQPAARGARAADGAGAPPQVAAVPALEQLLPSAPQLAREGYGEPAASEAAPARQPGERGDLLAHGEPWRAASHRPGTLDFIPDVREGDITLLNTKAERYSPFVRRVALRVFQNLVILLRRDLAHAGTSAQESVTVEAVMDRRGEMVSFHVTERLGSSSLGTDRNLQRACQEGFFDRNPPAGAEGADGNIRFLLNTRVMTLVDQTGRQLGYQAIFRAGLL